MSLDIECRNVDAVMLGGVWYRVTGRTFTIESLHFVGKFADEIPGFFFQCTDEALGFISGPLTALQAISETP